MNPNLNTKWPKIMTLFTALILLAAITMLPPLDARAETYSFGIDPVTYAMDTSADALDGSTIIDTPSTIFDDKPDDAPPPIIGATTSVDVPTPTTAPTAAQPLPQIKAKANQYIGVVSVPSVKLKANVYETFGAGLANLRKGAGHFECTPTWSGNVALCGHNRGSWPYFQHVKDIKVGATITYTTALGTRTYKVVSVRKVKATDVSILNNTPDNRITLTCCVINTPSLRWSVVGVETKTVSAKAATQK